MSLRKFPDQNETVWKSKLELVERGQVIPIVGSELLQMRVREPRFAWAKAADGAVPGLEAGERLVPWDAWVASELAERLASPELGGLLDPDRARRERIWPEADEKRLRLSTLVGRALQAGLNLTDIRDSTADVAEAVRNNPALRPSPRLVELAAITDFRIFVTTGLDHLLERAIEEAEPKGPKPLSIGYCHKKAQATDLVIPAEATGERVVYHLLGLPSRWDEFALSDKELLEMLAALQSPGGRPRLLFETLHERHLFFLGCSFPDWLARFILRLTNKGPFGEATPERTMVDARLRGDEALWEFLDLFSGGFSWFEKDVDVFVDRLTEQWTKRRKDRPREVAPTPVDPAAASKSGSNAPRIFLSYARDNREFARALYQKLRGAGLTVWFDDENLGPGAQWNLDIEAAVRGAAFFLPVISEQALRGEGSGAPPGGGPGRYLHFEWQMAQSAYMSSLQRKEYIIPVVIDATREGDPDLASLKGFLASNWTRIPATDTADRREALDRFANKMLELVRSRQRG